MRAYNVADLREAARRRLPRGLFDYVDRGTENEVSLLNNRQEFDRLQFVTRPLVDVSRRSTETSVFNQTWRAPICIAPTGLAGMLWHEGEIALARAAADAGIPFSLSTASITPLEEVAKRAEGNLWFQLYMWANTALSYELVHRAKAAGFQTLVVTIDSVVNGNREHNRRNGFTVPMRLTVRNVVDGALHPRWTFGVMGRYMTGSGMPRFANFPADYQADLRGKKGVHGGVVVPKNESLTWDDMQRLRDIWGGTLIVKGILRPEDADRAISCGADGIVVSNHGGRTLDGAVAPIRVLPAVAAAVNKRAVILVDSCVTRGSDVVKALALGADAVMIGRSALWGVAANGQVGAALALEIFKTEIDRVMAYLGCCSISEIGPAVIYRDIDSQGR